LTKKGVAIVLLAAVLLLAGCVQQQLHSEVDSVAQTEDAIVETAAVQEEATPAAVFVFSDYAVSPNETTINTGESVEWRNAEVKAFHVVDFGEFGSNELGPGDVYVERFDYPGDYWFVCSAHDHPTEEGVVHVRGS